MLVILANIPPFWLADSVRMVTMADYMHDLNPVSQIVADAVGEPGKRTFFLQARAGADTVSLVMEKQEVNSLALSVLQLLEDLEKQYPELPPATTRGIRLQVEPPAEPAFRVGELSIGYDEDDDQIWIVAKALVINEEGAVVDPEDDSVPAVRFVASRGAHARHERARARGHLPGEANLPPLRPPH